MTNVFLPKVQNFEKNLDFFFKSNEEVKEVVRQFDESICWKISKSEFNIYKEYVNDHYLHIEKLEEAKTNYGIMLKVLEKDKDKVFDHFHTYK